MIKVFFEALFVNASFLIDFAIKGGKDFLFLTFEESTTSFPLGKIRVHAHACTS